MCAYSFITLGVPTADFPSNAQVAEDSEIQSTWSVAEDCREYNCPEQDHNMKYMLTKATKNVRVIAVASRNRDALQLQVPTTQGDTKHECEQCSDKTRPQHLRWMWTVPRPIL